MIKKFKKIINLNNFIIFEKNNWLRNYLLNPEKINRLKNGILKGDTEDLLDHLFNLKESRLKQAKFNSPFNNQKTRTKAIKLILDNFKPEIIYETGTLLGNTTEFFSRFPSKVISIEISEFYSLISEIRFLDKENVEILLGDSGDILKEIEPNEKKVFFYLDAHSPESLPLLDEIENCLKFKNSIILIDDFEVPGNLGFGFDTYDGYKLSLENYKILQDYDLYFPNYDSNKDVGSRGYVVVDTSKNLKDIDLKDFPLALYE